MKKIVKRFPGVLALDHVDFDLRPGEVHMLLGENGAGKSTLIKVLSGAYQTSEGSETGGGEILVQGRKIEPVTPQAMLENGLRFIYQEINLVQQLDVSRNIFLGIEPIKFKRFGLVDERSLYRNVRLFLEKIGIDLDPRETVKNLSVTQQKLVEIARALITDAKALILDEPTDVLEDQSRRLLFDIILNLKEKFKVGFIYISHRYTEVHELGDRVTILRDGKNIGTHNVKEITLDAILEKMIGRKVGRMYPKLSPPSEETLLRVEHLTRRPGVSDISFDVKKGEIVAITGLMAAGKSELARTLAGADRMDSGRVLIGSEECDIRDPRSAIRAGIGFLTENRKSEGLIQDHSIRDNYALPSIDRLSPAGFVDHKKIDSETSGYMGKLLIKATDIYQRVCQLSGGNQQKIVLAKWLGIRSKLLIIDEPTRGLDISSRTAIYEIMKDLLDSGVSILMFTSDYSEALEMSHRLIILRQGKLCAVFNKGDITEEEILGYAVGTAATTGSGTGLNQHEGVQEV
jgi:ribose transport system ATP-binding protein